MTCNNNNTYPMFLALCLGLSISLAACSWQEEKASSEDYTQYVDRFIGTGARGAIIPVASVPFGMVQCGPNTYTTASGYHYDHNEILGFSHVNKSGAGCSDFLDILFVPLNRDRWSVGDGVYPKGGFPTRFSHEEETAQPGYYQVRLDGIGVQLTATARSGFHKYTFDKGGYLAVDLQHGNRRACTIVKEDNKDVVTDSGLRIIDSVTIEGWRISAGWAPEQHVYFYAKFSEPFKARYTFLDRELTAGGREVTGSDVRAILSFDNPELLVKVGVSPVSCEGARLNLEKEIPGWSFEKVRARAKTLWNEELSKIQIKTDDAARKRIFYTSLFNVVQYPMRYSDVDGRFRGPDHKVHQTDGFDYYGGVASLWDTYRAAMPLITFLRPDIANEYVQTFLEHYEHFGQLPIWVLAGNETFTMIGIHSLPIITDCYYKGIRDYDVDKAYKAMKVSAMKDTIGYSMRRLLGLRNYKKYGYVPADLEVEATALTLEYAYDDWCMARMAKALNKEEDYHYFLERSKSYRNVFDKKAGFMNGRFSNGKFRPNLDPFFSSHRRDDFCEGNAWNWTFFVPHDVEGLAELMGGKKKMAAKLDSLFSVSSNLSGENISGAISGLIGQYAHGNEVSHHIPYMYNYLGQPWKTQKLVHEILTTLYDDTPTGLCGNEDTGQMSAWYVFSAMGFYPMDPASQRYDIGSPLFEEIVLRVPNDTTFTVRAINHSDENIYVQEAKLNGQSLTHLYISSRDILEGGVLELTMGREPGHGFDASSEVKIEPQAQAMDEAVNSGKTTVSLNTAQNGQ